MEGYCTCRFVRYRLTDRPLFVHCCHCRWCQRETGSAFVMNALFASEAQVVPKHIYDGTDITRMPTHHIMRRVGDHDVRPLSHMLPRLRPGALLQSSTDGLPPVFGEYWPSASAERFGNT